MRICECLLKIFFVTRGIKKIFLHTHTHTHTHAHTRVWTYIQIFVILTKNVIRT